MGSSQGSEHSLSSHACSNIHNAHDAVPIQLSMVQSTWQLQKWRTAFCQFRDNSSSFSMDGGMPAT